MFNRICCFLLVVFTASFAAAQAQQKPAEKPVWRLLGDENRIYPSIYEHRNGKCWITVQDQDHLLLEADEIEFASRPADFGWIEESVTIQGHFPPYPPSVSVKKDARRHHEEGDRGEVVNDSNIFINDCLADLGNFPDKDAQYKILSALVFTSTCVNCQEKAEDSPIPWYVQPDPDNPGAILYSHHNNVCRISVPRDYKGKIVIRSTDDLMTGDDSFVSETIEISGTDQKPVIERSAFRAHSRLTPDAELHLFWSSCLQDLDRLPDQTIRKRIQAEISREQGNPVRGQNSILF